MANKGTGIRLVGPVIWGLSYVVTSEDLEGWEDLRGKKIPMIGRGLTPDITFRHLLEKNGLNPDEDLEIVYVSAATELVPVFLTGRSTVCMMPEPMITTVLSRKPDTRILVDIQEEWRNLYGSSYPQASLVVSGAFADTYPDFTRDFTEAFAAAVEAAKADPVAAGEAVNALAPELNADIIAEAVPRMNLDFITADEARPALEDYFRVLEAFNPATIGGKLPTDDFYLP
ncbi:MAG: ABC transporter substrate-binding protein, partial [Spirochaetaceae bacterium]|nr:ABC transporter substrate-binding protein [Spirochaetaceae bacterium]